MDMRRDLQGAPLAIAAALLFGLVSVAAKSTAAHPLLKAGIAYLIAGLVLSTTPRRIRIGPRDWPKVLAMSLLGGAIAPTLLFIGLDRTTAATASILLTLEMVFTAVLATVFLRERTRGRALVGIALLFLAALLAGVPTADAGSTTLAGAALVAAAALGWGIDNTISAKLVGAYRPQQLVAIKGLVGGSAALTVAVARGADLTMGALDLARVAFVGLLGVGASILLFYGALGRIGATRTTAIFIPVAALAGVAGGWLILREPIGWQHTLAAGLVVAGVLLGVAPTGGLSRRGTRSV